MRSITKRIGGVFVALILMFSVVTAAPAAALGPIIDIQYDHLQPGEQTLVYAGKPCPSIAGNELLGTFTDSSSMVFTDTFAGGVLPSNGQWTSGVFTVPETAALGGGTLEIYCTLGGNPTKSLGILPVVIVGQSTNIVVDRVNAWHEATFSPVTACDAYAPVRIQLYGQPVVTPGSATFGTDISDQVSSDSSGMWTYSVILSPTNGFNLDFVYTLRATCANMSGDYEYGGYSFTLKGDQYVALGDSYSSGVGTNNYNLDFGYCSRSTDSYVYYIVENLPADLPNFQACAGAVTDDLFTGYIMDSPQNPIYLDGQFSQLSADTEFVTLTIGGNDADFEGVLERCSHHLQNTGFGCSTDSSFTTTATNRIHALAWLPSEHPGQTQPIVNTSGGSRIHSYVEILQAIQSAAPNAEVYIAGYPRLFGEDTAYWMSDSSAPGGYKCEIHGGLPSVTVAYDDALWMNDRVNVINGAVQAAVAEVGSTKITYVPTPGFYNHGHCDTGTSYINQVELDGFDPTIESFHPTATGMHDGYGVAFVSEMN